MAPTTTVLTDDSALKDDLVPDGRLQATECFRKLLLGFSATRPVREQLRRLDLAGDRDRHSQLFLSLYPGCRSWKQVVEALNAARRSVTGRTLDTLYGLYVSCGFPVWKYVECQWQHRDNCNRFTTTERARECDREKFGCDDYRDVPGLTRETEADILAAI
jgi:hypothetical protein